MKRTTIKELKKDTECTCDNCIKKAEVKIIERKEINFCKHCGEYYIKSSKT